MPDFIYQKAYFFNPYPLGRLDKGQPSVGIMTRK
jgi:hypothetical protein